MPTTGIRRRLLLAAGAAGLATPALAQAPWPNRPIRMIIPFAPGGSTDVIGRLLAEQMSQRLGQPIVIENRGGAGATLGTGLVADAAPDGYTVLLSPVSAFNVGATLYRGRITWDPVRSFAHVAMIQRGYYALMANNRAPFTNPAELAAAARRTPGINYATSGVGSLPHLVMLRFAQMAGIELTHVPYRGGAQAVNDVIAGNVPVTLDGIAASVGFLRQGNIRGIGLTGPQRHPDFPDMPTFVEHGFPQLVAEGWAGFSFPAGVPRPIQQRLADVTKEVLDLPAIRERYRTLANDVGDRFMDDFQRFVAEEVETWRPLVIASGATVD
ncbi:Bug family tripartite tricarboxylate transporter substrate binding protein [Falsiroseomonas oryzae]|uniref:Bug family tripartite tricarboxylate transporter substrate binding protein n=1 Tax=Falsiroseomonas oryzae TaxID=2766473 RepID=UPI0022EB7D3F|nr:tripartite tricarboxylate transporter substrate binding protein [Roseomonas sp. MO-31]